LLPFASKEVEELKYKTVERIWDTRNSIAAHALRQAREMTSEPKAFVAAFAMVLVLEELTRRLFDSLNFGSPGFELQGES